jgi:ribonuclease BN (tRNA processing enzyme)
MAIKVTLLGTGGPRPDPRRAQPAVLIEVDAERYLVDCGDGTTRRLLDAEIDPASIRTLLLTHLHIDHCLGVAAFVYAGWFAGRESLRLFGPTGTRELGRDLLDKAYGPDAQARFATGRPMAGLTDVAVTQIQPGLVLETSNCRITTMPVPHNAPTETYALRFDDGANRSVVISSDTTFCEPLADFARGTDLLVHEAYVTSDNWGKERPGFQQMLRGVHVTPAEAGTIGRLAGARTLVLTHFPPKMDDLAVAEEACRTFGKPVTVGQDLMSFEV